MLKQLVFLCLVGHTLCLPARSVRPRPDGRIVGGSPTTISKVPYNLSLQYLGKHLCGGGIISTKAAITAANCFLSDDRPISFTVRVGSTDSSVGGYTLSVSEILINSAFNPETIDCDLAIVYIPGAFPFNDVVNVVTIPPAGPYPPAGTPAHVTGWGALEEEGSFSNRLHEVTVPIVDKEVCNTAYEGKITDRMLCAGYMEGGKDACIGDSGSPLVIDNTLYGVVSWGYGCARPGYPGVYTNVAYLRDFIISNIG